VLRELAAVQSVFPRLDEDHEQPRPTVETTGDVGQCVDVSDPATADSSVGVLLGLSGAAVVAICAAIVAWLKWRHPPDNK